MGYLCLPFLESQSERKLKGIIMAVEKEVIEAIAQIAMGKEEGFNTLYSHTYNYVYNRAKLIMKNEEDALDLTQETYIHAYKGIGSLNDANNVYAWLGGIVYRQGMMIFRKKRELLVSEEAEGIFDEVISEDTDTAPEESMQAKATSEIVMGMIEELPELQRAAVMAFYYDNMKIDDIAAAHDCSANTIKSRLNYAKKFLKEKVEEHEKKNQYKLCAVSPAIILWAFKQLFATKDYTMSPVAAEATYSTVCSTMGMAPSALTSASVATGTTSTATGTVAATATKVGMSLGTKIAISLAGIATVGGITTAAILNSGDKKDIMPPSDVVMEESFQADYDEQTNTDELPLEPEISEEDILFADVMQEICGEWIASRDETLDGYELVVIREDETCLLDDKVFTWARDHVSEYDQMVKLLLTGNDREYELTAKWQYVGEERFYTLSLCEVTGGEYKNGQVLGSKANYEATMLAICADVWIPEAQLPGTKFKLNEDGTCIVNGIESVWETMAYREISNGEREILVYLTDEEGKTKAFEFYIEMSETGEAYCHSASKRGIEAGEAGFAYLKESDYSDIMADLVGEWWYDGNTDEDNMYLVLNEDMTCTVRNQTGVWEAVGAIYDWLILQAECENGNVYGIRITYGDSVSGEGDYDFYAYTIEKQDGTQSIIGGDYYQK